MRIEEEGGGGRVVQRIEEVEGVDVDTEEVEVEDFGGEEVVELELPVRGKRRMITGGGLASEGVGVGKGKGKGRVTFDLGGEEVGRKKVATAKKRKG